MRGAVLLALLGLAGCAAPPADAPPPGTVLTVTTNGVAQNILLVAPPTPPVAAVIMFPGGDGRIGITADGTIARNGNFLIRTRREWVAEGFLFVAVDAPADTPDEPGSRVGPANQQAIAAIVRTVRQRTGAPIWLVGTSAGAPAAMAGAASAPAGTVRGVVISSPVSVAGPRDTVFDAALDHVAVPVLIQVHDGDQCGISSPGNAPRIKAALTAAPVVDIQHYSGGDFPRSKPCEALRSARLPGD